LEFFRFFQNEGEFLEKTKKLQNDKNDRIFIENFMAKRKNSKTTRFYLEFLEKTKKLQNEFHRSSFKYFT